MIGIERITEHVTAFPHVVLAQLLSSGLGVMAADAQRRELLKRRIEIAAALNGGAMIDDSSGLNSANLQACLTKWVFSQFVPAQPLPSLRRVRPGCHSSPN